VALLDDVVISLGTGISVASLVIVLSLLSRYKNAVDDAHKSSQLSKNLWDAMNARLTTQDARIVDLMAKLEVYSVRRILPASSVSAPKSVISQSESHDAKAVTNVSRSTSQVQITGGSRRQSTRVTNNTELTILHTLLQGPKASNNIKEVIQVTREHNARLLKGLYERGLVVRDDQHKPFVYEISEAGKAYLTSAESVM
jgi:DNA-binding MarR family transcriptional regulator